MIMSVSRRADGRRRNVAFASAVLLASSVLAVVVAAPASAAANPTPSAGERRSATRLPFDVSGTARLSVDVGTGNAFFTDQLFTLPGVVNDVPISLSYNSSAFGSSAKSAVTGTTGSGWAITGFDQRLIKNADNSITYFGPGGLSGVFAVNGTGYTAPDQFQADLVFTSGTGYTLTDHATQEKLTFTTAGRLTSDKDRNGNTTTYAYDGSGYPASVTSSRGFTQGRKVTVTTSGGRITALSQTSGSTTRTVTLGYSPNQNLASVTDTTNAVIGFASAYQTDTGEVVSITNPLNAKTTLTFDGSDRVTKIAQDNPTSHGGAGTASTRLAYPTSSQTVVADPTTNQSVAVGSVPNTTYDLTANGSKRVDSTTDPDGNARSRTYTTLNNVASATPAAGGATTFGYGANGGESLTSVGSPGGATQTASYGNSGANAYLPSSSSNDSGNSLSYTYNSAGNPTGTQSGTAGGTGPTAKVTYNNNGTAATSASPGAATGVTTNYGYDSATANLTSITPPSSSSLGGRTYTWDGFGRLKTATTGAGATLTYTYDLADRITGVDYSDSTPDVTYTYNALGKITQRTDGTGTSTYTYDDLGNQLTVASTAGGGTFTYTYDLDNALHSTTSLAGTVTYGYDDARLLTSMTYPHNGSTQTTQFANDANGRRTDVWMQTSGTNHTSWAAHQKTTYDNSGRVKTVLGQNGPASSPTTVVDQTLCYAANSTAPSCSTASANDRSQIQWVKDAVSGETSSYTYNSDNRLTKTVVTGGSNPRTYTYGYDNAGNRTSSSVTGSSPTSQSLSYNAGNQISTSGYSYDGAGNQTARPGRTATFNAAGHQTSTTVGSTTTTYSYAGTDQNELTQQATAGGATYKYRYGRPDSNGLPQIETVEVAGSTSGTGYVFHDPDGKPVMIQTQSDVESLYLYNATGSPVGLSTSFSTTAVALQYDPYGASTRTDSGGANGAWTDNPYDFGTGIKDRVTGQIKFGARWYNPGTGGWTQQDQLNSPLDPKNANRYAYAAGDPINQFDPTGTSIFSAIGDFAADVGTFAGAGAAIGGGIGLLAGGPVGAGTGAAIGGAIGTVVGIGYGVADIFID